MQSTPYRVYGYGRARVSGAIMLKESSAGHLFQVQALTGHRIDGFEAIWLNDDPVTVPTLGNNFAGDVSEGADGRYSGNCIHIETRLGLTPENYYPFIKNDIPAQWTVNHRGDGCASMALKFSSVPLQDFSKRYPYGAPQPSAVARLAPVFDPRDPAQSATDQTTFQWDDNPVLAILHFLCFSAFGPRMDYATVIAPFAAEWSLAAQACDEQVPLKAGGTEKRYALGGWTTTEQARMTTLNAMLQACDGILIRRGLGYVPVVGKYQAPTVTLIDDDIAAFSIQSDVATEDRVNEAVARYTSPDNGYVTVDSDPVLDEDDIAARGGSPRKAQMDLPWVQSTGQASRLLKREIIRQKQLRGQIVVHWSGLNAAYERWIAVNSNTIPRLSGAVIENRKAVIDPKTRTATIDFLISGPSIEDYNAATDESAPPVVPQRPVTVGLPVPSNVSVVGVLNSDASGASSVILDVTWDLPYNNGTAWNLNYSVRWRLTDAGAGQPGNWAQQSFATPSASADRITVETTAVAVGVSYDVQVASIGTTSSLSTWSALHTVSTVLSNLAPAAPTWVSATGGVGSVALSVKAPASPNFASVQFYRAASGGSFASATAIGSPVTGSPSATITYTDNPAAGTYSYFAVSETSAAVASPPAGPQSGTAT